MKKRILSLALVLVMSIACLTGCSNGNAGTEATSGGVTGVEAAKDYLFQMYKPANSGKATATANDFTVVGLVKISGVTYTIDWSVSPATDVVKVGTINEKKMVTISVNSKTASQVDYTLTATLTDENGNSASTSFNYFVPAYNVYTWAKYVAAEKDENIVVQGVVTALLAKSKGASSNSIYFQDNDGAYYAYGAGAVDPYEAGIKPGMTIEVSGTRDTYSGTYEIVNYGATIVDSSIKTVVAEDYTEKFKNASSLKDEALTAQQSRLVTLKGVEITGIGSDPTYYNFSLGGKTSYVRISSSSCPLDAEEKETFKSVYESHVGYTADVTGIMTLYDGAFYITPVTTDCFSNFTLVQKSDAEKVAYESEKLGIPAKVQEDTTIALHTTGSVYNDVAISYSVEGDAATLENDTLTITQGDQAATVKITATIKCGKETQTVVTEINVDAKATDMCEAEVIAKAFALAEGEAMSGKQVLRGTIKEITNPYDEKYGNITFTLDLGNDQVITVYRAVGGAELKTGDVVTVCGNIKNYKGTVEFDAKCVYSKELSVEQMKQTIVIEKALALAEGEAMPGTQVLSGKITEITNAYDEKYGNITFIMQVTDDFSITVYRAVGGSELKVGDIVTVTGTIKNYKGTIEFDSKCTYVPGEQLSYAKDVVVMQKAYALAEGEVMPGTQEVTGTISEIVTAYNETYNNISFNLKVNDEYTIQAFRAIGGAELKAGDTVTVTGTIKNYKGTVEFDAKCTYTK